MDSRVGSFPTVLCLLSQLNSYDSASHDGHFFEMLMTLPSLATLLLPSLFFAALLPSVVTPAVLRNLEHTFP